MLTSEVFKAAQMAEYLNLDERQCARLASDGVLFRNASGEYKKLPSIRGYIRHLQESLNDDDRGPKYDEEVRRLRRENERENSLVDTVENIEAVYTPLMNKIFQTIDKAPATASKACPAVDGRGRQKIAAAFVGGKNRLAQKHFELFGVQL